MAMTVIWTGMTVGALVFSLALGNQAALAPAALCPSSPRAWSSRTALTSVWTDLEHGTS